MIEEETLAYWWNESFDLDERVRVCNLLGWLERDAEGAAEDGWLTQEQLTTPNTIRVTDTLLDFIDNCS